MNPPAAPTGSPLPAVPVPAPAVSESADGPRRLMLLEGLAAELADQRLHLAEQFERLLRAQERWQEERDQVTAELEVVGVRLQERERSLDLREQGLAPAEKALVHRRDEAVQVRFHLEAWRARLSARETAWEAERDQLLADLAAREQVLDQQQQLLAGLRQRWARRRQQELEQLRVEQGRCREAFQHYTGLWAECFRRSSLLEQEQRTLAEKALALEQYRLECIGHAENSAMAEKRLERLRRRWAALSAAAERRLACDRQALEAQLASLEERFRDLDERTIDLDQRRVDRSNRLTDEEQAQASAEEEAARMQQSLHTLRVQRDLNQWQLDRLRDEMERMAMTLIEEADCAPPAMQAA